MRSETRFARGRRFTVLLRLFALLALLLPWARQAQGGTKPFPVFSDSAEIRLEENLTRHYQSREVKAWRESCSAEERKALDFLFAWLPPADLGSWPIDQIREDIALAIQTRHEAPWSAKLTDPLFYTYVLPHRVAQEPIQRWRPELHRLLWPRVQGMSLREAALEANRFCREYATFIPTSSRDQGPLTTMVRGLGRCEEEQIFYICAARSVGIPARSCATPWWTASDNNHAWVEVFTGDGWHYLGACEPAADLDQAWFTGPARRAGLVLSLAYGEGEFPGEQVHAQAGGVTLINSTGVYARTGSAHVEWADSRERSEVPIFVHVFNSGGLSVLGQFRSDAPIVLGPGGYVATCEVDGKPLAARFDIRSGESSPIRFDPSVEDGTRWEALERPFWLRIPVPAEPAAEPAAKMPAKTGGHSPGKTGGGSASVVDPAVQQKHEKEIARHDAERKTLAHPDSLDLLRIQESIRETLNADTASFANLKRRFTEAGARAHEWASFLASVRGDTFRVACTLIQEMDDKDFIESDPGEARHALAQILALGKRRPSSTPDSIWNAFVVSPRIDFQPCDFALWSELPLYNDAGMTPDQIHREFTKKIHPAKTTRLGHLARPSETWRSGFATPAAGRVALVGLMRRNGVPARIEPSRRWVEVFVDGAWIPADPFDPDSWNRKVGEVEQAYVEPGTLDVRFTELGAPLTHAEGWMHFRLARFDKGRFDSPLIDYPVQDGHLVMPLEPGEWWLFGGLRNHEGSARVAAQRVQIESGKTIGFALDLGIPANERDPEDLAPKQLSAEALAVCGQFGPTAEEEEEAEEAEGAEKGAGGREGVGARDEEGRGGEEERDHPSEAAREATGVLIVLWTPDSEPCLRTANVLTEAQEAFEDLGLETLSIQVQDVGRGQAAAKAELLPFARRRLTISAGEMKSLFGLDDTAGLPALAILDRSGKTRLFLEGMQLAPEDLIRQAMAQ